MSIEPKGKNLIFLISTPRTGSTMLQAILVNHPLIHTLPEPWIVLPHLYGMYSKKINRQYRTEYNRYWARTHIRDFVKRLPAGKEDYLAGIRLMCSYWYNRARADSGKKYFLDKGPRYYHILPELVEVFPEAVFIILLRNPLAVLNSIINTVNEKKCPIHEFKQDLINAPSLLLKGIRLLEERCIVVHYESILKNPAEEIGKICTKLGINFSSEILNYSFKEEYKNAEGYKMQKQAYQNGSADAKNIDKWALSLKNPKIWRLANDYLHYLGKKTIKSMGYSYDEMEEFLDKYNPGWFKLRRTTGLFRLLKISEIDSMLKRKKFRGLKEFLKRCLLYLIK